LILPPASNNAQFVILIWFPTPDFIIVDCCICWFVTEIQIWQHYERYWTKET